MKRLLTLVFLTMALVACKEKSIISDAYGNFECDEVLVSSQVAGTVESFTFEEGDFVELNEVVAVIDTTDINLMLEDLLLQKTLIKTKYAKAESDQAILLIEKNKAKEDKERYENLYTQNAIAKEQLESYQTRYSILEEEYAGSSLSLKLLSEEMNKLDIKAKQLRVEKERYLIKAPIQGNILAKYVQKGELVLMGKALFKLADLSTLYLKAYVGEKQLSEFALNDQVVVLYDTEDGISKIDGRVAYISPKAEFTPKTIQTRDERENLVYGIKIRVAFNERIKIGMPGEVIFKRKR